MSEHLEGFKPIESQNEFKANKAVEKNENKEDKYLPCLKENEVDTEHLNKVIDDYKKLSSDECIKIYHGTKEHSLSTNIARRIASSSEYGIVQNGNLPTFAIFPVGGYFENSGLIYQITRGEISFPGDKEARKFSISEHGAVLINPPKNYKPKQRYVFNRLEDIPPKISLSMLDYESYIALGKNHEKMPLEEKEKVRTANKQIDILRTEITPIRKNIKSNINELKEFFKNPDEGIGGNQIEFYTKGLIEELSEIELNNLQSEGNLLDEYNKAISNLGILENQNNSKLDKQESINKKINENEESFDKQSEQLDSEHQDLSQEINDYHAKKEKSQKSILGRLNFIANNILENQKKVLIFKVNDLVRKTNATFDDFNKKTDKYFEKLDPAATQNMHELEMDLSRDEKDLELYLKYNMSKLISDYMSDKDYRKRDLKRNIELTETALIKYKSAEELIKSNVRNILESLKIQQEKLNSAKLNSE